MDARELEILAKLLARAKPPPILYRYRKPNEWTLAEISNQRIFATSPDNLNDPFECSAPVCWNRKSLRQHFIEVFAPTCGLSRVLGQLAQLIEIISAVNDSRIDQRGSFGGLGHSYQS
jgi:hypothetical protein